jgi:hypothetical protein
MIQVNAAANERGAKFWISDDRAVLVRFTGRIYRAVTRFRVMYINLILLTARSKKCL